MLKFASDVLDFVDAGDVTILALLDLSDAFATGDHGILLQRLILLKGIFGTALHWMRSFLSYRLQTVQICRQAINSFDLDLSGTARVSFSDR